MLMRKMRLLLVVLALAVLSASNCIQKQYVEALEKSYAPVQEDYKKLLEEKSGYQADTIRIRSQTADEHMKLIREGKK
jgi:outer membrane lipoprotein-sorting protein